MCVVYGLNYLDKTTLSYASVMGMKKDIGLVGDDYQWLGSLFYFGYLGWEYPTTFLLQRAPLGKYSSINIIMWGVTLSCFAAVNNFAGAVAIRFFLGVFEAAVTPGKQDTSQSLHQSFTAYTSPQVSLSSPANGIQRRSKASAQPFGSASMASHKSLGASLLMVLPSELRATARR